MPKKKSTCRLEIKETGKRTVTVTLYIDGSNYTANPRDIEVSNPLSEEDKEDLRWYLEDFLDLAIGGYLDRAEKIEKRMKEWGEAIFEQVFIKHPDFDNDPRSLYLKAAERQLRNVEIAIDCRDPYLLSIPWELMKDSENGFIALQSAGFYRQETSVNKPVTKKTTTTGRRPFRILLVISRPKINDIPLSMVARPMLKAIKDKRDIIEVDLLRPPTFDNLQRTFTEKQDYYDLVHFDGHGGFAAEETGARGTQRYQVEAEKGVLLFENDDHTPHYVSTNELADELYGAGVPLFILNACESAKSSDLDPYSSIAANLVKCGACGVVAMSYSVLAITASCFMERFYERLISGSTLCKSVRDARCRIHSEPFRYPLIGEKVELDDWIIPVIYQQEEGFIPIKPVKKKKTKEKTVPISALIIDLAEERCPEGRHGFVGRDNDILDIERELTDDDKPWLLITGMSGSGKTDLAYGFARWYASTGGCPGGIFKTDFKSRADLEQIFGSIAGLATDFFRLSDEDQFDAIVKYLKENRCLLIIDNIETASGYPEKHEPFASQEQLKDMSRFFKALEGGKSRVILTTRKTKEDWPGVAAKRKPIGGLDIHGSLLMAESILDTIGKKTADFVEDHENFAELFRLLKGHPRSLEVVIPMLETKRPAEIIEALRYVSGEMEDISMNIAFENLSENAKKYLPLAGLFSSWMHMSNLKNMIELKAENISSMKEIFKHDFDEAEMDKAFDEATRAGLIDRYTEYLLGLHPTFPVFLRNRLISVIGEDGLASLDYVYMLFYGIWSDSIFEGVNKKDPAIMNEVSFELPNLLRAARIAENEEKWEILLHISQIIITFYEARGRYIERGSFRDRLIKNIGEQLSDEEPLEKSSLKLFLLGNMANDLISRSVLERAEKINEMARIFLEGKKGDSFEKNLAVLYHQMGRIAEERHSYDEAESLYRKALEISERLGLEADAAVDYHQLGMIEQKRHRYDEAEAWYRKALEIEERLGLEAYAASDYHQLGMVEQKRHRYDEAESWYRKALEIKERLGLGADVATDYHQLGMIAEERHRYNEAEAWYRKALEIKERLGLESSAAITYHQIGNISYFRHKCDEAEEWYMKALEIKERLGLEADAAYTYHQLGIIADELHLLDKAKVFYKRAVGIFEKYGMDYERAASYHQLGILALDQNLFDEAEIYFLKAISIYKLIDYPPLMVNSITKYAFIKKAKGDMTDSVLNFYEALSITEKYNIWEKENIVMNALKSIIKDIGQDDFKNIWNKISGGKDLPGWMHIN